MRLHVEGERVSVSEDLVARWAFVDFDGLIAVGVDSLFMGCKVSRVRECLPAHVALKGLLACVEVLVLQEPSVHEETFPANVTEVFVLLVVAPFVHVERRLVHGRVRALVALEALLLRVLALVHLHLVRPFV